MAVEVIDFQVYCYLVENVRTLHPEAGGTTFVLLLLLIGGSAVLISACYLFGPSAHTE